MKKRVFLLLMAVALAVVATVFTAPAAAAVDTNPADGTGWCYACEKDVTWTALPEGWAPSTTNNDQHYHFYLTADRAIGNPAWSFTGKTSAGTANPHKVCFHLNGHKLGRSGGYFMSLDWGSEVHFMDNPGGAGYLFADISATTSVPIRMWNASKMELHNVDLKIGGTTAVTGTGYTGYIYKPTGATACTLMAGGGIGLESAGTQLDIYGDSVLTGNRAMLGGTIYVGEGAVVNLHSGTIQDGIANTAWAKENNIWKVKNVGYGGNVYVKKGATFNMYGGTIQNGGVSHTTASAGSAIGGNVYVAGTFNMQGGTITGGGRRFNVDASPKAWISGDNLKLPASRTHMGGNVCVSGTFNMQGGTVSNGIAQIGGNIQVVTGGKLTLGAEAIVSGGDATSKGGNIYINNASLALNGTTVSGGTAGRTEAVTVGTTTLPVTGSGGNIYLAGTAALTLHSGNVTGGTAGANGGNICVEGTTTLTTTGGTVSGGTAANGGNLAVLDGGVATLSGVTVQDGTATNGNNIYVGRSAADKGAATLNLGSNLTVDGTGTDIYLDNTYDETTGNQATVNVTAADVGDTYISVDAAVKPCTLGTSVADQSLTMVCLAEGYVTVYENGKMVIIQGSTDPVAAVYNGTQLLGEYNSLALAMRADGSYIKLLCDWQENVTVTGTVLVDLNGYDLSGITVAGTFYGMDTTTDRYGEATGSLSCTLSGDGKVASNVKTTTAGVGAIKRYLAVEENGKYTFNRFYIGITHVVINPEEDQMGVSYKATFAGNQAVKDSLQGYGLAAAVESIPESLIEKHYVDFGVDTFPVGTVVNQMAYITDILKPSLEDSENATRANTETYARTYVQLQGGELIFSSEYMFTLQDMVELVDTYYNTYTAEEKEVLKQMYSTYSGVMENWAVPYIRHSDITWTDVSAASQLKTSGNMKLTQDVTLTSTISIPAGSTLNLCLNGHTLSGSVRLFNVSGTLNICDCHTGTTAGKIVGGAGGMGPVFYSYATSEINLYSGELTSSKQASDGGVGIVQGGVLNMYGGKIYGGSVTRNTSNANSWGLGGNLEIISGGVFNMYGGEITGGQTTSNGGNIYVSTKNSTLNLYGGKITGGTASGKGGNIFVAGAGKFNIYGGEITGGTATGNGGNIYTESTSATTISNGVITGGKAANGGNIAIYNAGTYTFDRNTIADGTATGKGGNIYIDKNATATTAPDVTFTGTITGGSGTGTGIYAAGSKLTFTGKVVMDQLYLAEGQTVTATDLNTKSSVGITVAATGVFAKDSAAYEENFYSTIRGLDITVSGTDLVIDTMQIPEENQIQAYYDDRISLAALAANAQSVDITNQNVTSYKTGTTTKDTAVLVYDAANKQLIATATGSAMVWVDGEAFVITVSPAPISLFMITGHSMGAGECGDANDSVVLPDGVAYSTHGAATFSSATATMGIGYSATSKPTGINAFTADGTGTKGEGSGFALKWTQLTGEKVWVLNSAVGGSCLPEWIPAAANYTTGNGYNDYYTPAVKMFKAAQTVLANEAKAGHYVVKDMGIIYHYGANFVNSGNGNNYTFTQEDLKNWYSQMWNGFKAEFTKDMNGDGVAETVTSLGMIPIWRKGDVGVYKDDVAAGYFMASSAEYPEFFQASTLGKKWQSDAGVVQYFPDINYTAHSGTLTKPTTMAGVFATDNTHYQQVSYNAVGMDIASSVYSTLRSGNVTISSLELKNAAGDTALPTTLSVGQSLNVVPWVTPVNVDDLTYSVSGNLTLSYPCILRATAPGTGTLTVKQGDTVVKTVTFTIGGHSDYTTVTDASQLTGSGSYQLGSDVTLTSAISVPSGSTLNLCLNGYTLTGSTTARMFNVSGTLNICDCHTGATAGKIVGNAASMGGVMYVTNGTVNLYGGELTCAVQVGDGGVILLQDAKFNMYGGKIYGGSVKKGASDPNSTTWGIGGNVYIIRDLSRFNLYGGEIYGGTAAASGGNFYLSKGTLNVYGGKIYGGNASAAGGNIFVAAAAKLNVYGGEITGGTAKTTGGNIHCASTDGNIPISDAVITGGKAATGGNLYLTGAGTYVIKNNTINTGTATIGGNISIHAGADVTFTGTVTTGNSGGIYVTDSELTLTGKVNISGNTGSDLYLEAGQKITVDNLDQESSVGISMTIPTVFAEGAAAYKDNFTSNSDWDIEAVNGDLKMGGTITADPDTFSVGFARADIHPRWAVPLDGMGYQTVSKQNWTDTTGNPEDLITAGMVVIADGQDWQNTVVLVALDTLYINTAVTDAAATAVSAAIGIPKENVFFSCSHTHSGVATADSDPDVTRYLQWMYGQLAEGAMNAVLDLKATTIEVGRTDLTAMNFVRRFVLTDGTYKSVTNDSSFTSDDIAAYESENDPELQVIKFVREGKDVLVTNWQMHPTFTAGASKNGKASADVVGSIRELVEADTTLDAYYMFFQGGGGNLRYTTMWAGDPDQALQTTNRQTYAEKMVAALKSISYEDAQSGAIQVTHVDKDMTEMAKSTTTSEYKSVPLNAVSFGEVAFVTAPYEMFSDNAMQIKEGSPFKLTLVCSNSNGRYSYIPCQVAFEHCQEGSGSDATFSTFEVKQCKFQKITKGGVDLFPAEVLVEEFITMLESIQ